MGTSELVIALISSVLGAFFRLWSNHQENQRMYYNTLLKAQTQSEKSHKRAMSAGFEWCKSAVLLLTVFFIVVFPKIVAVFWPQCPVLLTYYEFSSGFLFFTDGHEVLKYLKADGLLITPLDTNILYAIIGYYFGASVTRIKR